MQIIPIVLSGGAGTRLWPVSREALPKPFMRVGSSSLLQQTFDRIAAVDCVEHSAVVTNVAYSYKVAEELASRADGRGLSLLLEPTGRNTAPAIALSALWAHANFGGGSVLLILPADHVIERPTDFAAAVADAASLAVSRGCLVLFGIQPTSPETGYGYIEWADAIPGTRGHLVRRFVEKPEVAVASKLIEAGNHVWNSGMFCFTADAILTELRCHAPDVLTAAERVFQATQVAGSQVTFDAAAFPQLPDISIDYAVMERSDRCAVIPCNFGWSDVGTWKSVAQAHGQSEIDSEGNRAEGNAILVNARRTYVRSERRLVAAVGVEDLVVVDTDDAVLVAHKDASQEVKQVVQRLKSQGSEAYRLHTTVHRPWGSYTTLEESQGFKIKRIVVRPGQALSLQLHHQRSEHWVVVSGEAEVTIGEDIYKTLPNQSRYIPVGAKHRLFNPTSEPLVLIEVQCGAYLGEDDIVRFEDRYGRAPQAA